MDCKEIDYKNIAIQSDVIAGIVSLDVESISCFRDLDGYVHSDQGVATLVLRAVNSPLYRRGKTIGNIPMAISVLGFNVVRSLAMLAISRALFAESRNPLFRLHVWHHSLLTALAAQVICRDLGNEKESDEAFIAGLLHDIGKVLLCTHEPRSYLDVLSLVLEQGIPSIAAEQQVFGCDHCQVGLEAVTQWKLPERFADYIATDLSMLASPRSGETLQLGLALANCLIRDNGIGARPQTDPDATKARLLAFGVDEVLAAPWLEEGFVTTLMDNETYQLCANL